MDRHNKPTFIMVPRKLLIAWFSSWFVLFILVLASFQYTNYVDRRSNSLFCGIITTFDETYQKKPPASETGQALVPEIRNLRNIFKCK